MPEIIKLKNLLLKVHILIMCIIRRWRTAKSQNLRQVISAKLTWREIAVVLPLWRSA